MREMKDSGIEWIGKVPQNWAFAKIVNLYSLRVEKVSDQDFEPLSVTMKGIVPQLETAAKTNDGDNRKLVRKGDFAINSRSDRRGSCGISKYNGSVSLINTVLKPRKRMSPEYFDWLFHCTLFSDEFYRWGHGIVNDLWTTNWQDMKRITLPNPPLSEQQSIAKYLDIKCYEIDALSTDIQKQINTLEEYKCSVITYAVTKGLDKNVKMKESGVQWVDKIPHHWASTRIGYGTWIRARLGWKGLKADEYVDDGIIFLSAFNIINNQLNLNNLNYISQYRYDESPEIKIKKGDILLVKDGAGIGKCAKIDDNFSGGASVNGSLAVISSYDKINYEYLYYYLLSSMFQNYILQVLNGMGVPHLTQEELRKIKIPLPPISEQNKISDYLNNKCKEINNIISDKKIQLETLLEYKKSLIYEYVTGKKEVNSINVVLIDDKSILTAKILSLIGKNFRGKVQVQKTIYFCETMLDINLSTQYYRYEHGPYDKNIDIYLKYINSKQWFEIRNESPMKCIKGRNYSEFIRDYSSAFSKYKSDIENIVNFIKSMKTSQVERIATLYAAWNDFIIDGTPNPTDDQIIHEVLTNWTPNKADFKIETWFSSLNKMKNNGFIPTGHGLHTKHKEEQQQ